MDVGCEDSIHADVKQKWRDCTMAMERSPPRPEDESSAQRSRVDDQTPPDPGGVQSSPPPVAPPSTPFGTVAASRLVKAGESFIALEAQSCSRGFAHVVELGHESAGQCDFDRGPNWMLERTVDDSVIVGPLTTARLTARSNDRELAEQDKPAGGLHLRRDGLQHVQPLQGLWRTLAGWRSHRQPARDVQRRNGVGQRAGD